MTWADRAPYREPKVNEKQLGFFTGDLAVALGLSYDDMQALAYYAERYDEHCMDTLPAPGRYRHGERIAKGLEWLFP